MYGNVQESGGTLKIPEGFPEPGHHLAGLVGDITGFVAANPSLHILHFSGRRRIAIVRPDFAQSGEW